MSNTWQVELLRLTIFTPRLVDVDPQQWWVDVVGDAPDSVSSQPKLQQYQVEDNYENGRLVLQVKQDRIDWLYVAVNTEPNITFNLIGSIEDAQSTFLSIVERWLKYEGCPPIVRIAFGSNLMCPMPDKESSYAHLDSLLPSVQVDPTGSSDILYRINRPRTIEFENKSLDINRVSTWTTLKVEQFTVKDGVPNAPQTIGFSSRLELDINTVPAFLGFYSGQQMLPLFQELLQSGNEVSAQGDIP